jgi:hypothetical protein
MFLFSSEFVSMRVIHDLYQMCCEKRFSAYPVQKLTPPPRTTLYKYLVIPKEGQPPRRPPQMQQPTTPNYETRPTTNPFEQFTISQPTTDGHQPPPPPEIKRRTVYNEHEARPRSDTLPFLEHTEQLQPLSTMRSGNGSTTTRRVYHPRHDEDQQQQQHQEEEQ